jgi:HlyD family secretion protein
MTTTAKRFRISPWWGLLLIPIGLFAAISTGAIKPPRPPGAPPLASSTPTVETVTVQPVNFRVAVTGPGTLEATNSFEVKPSTTGTILELPEVGQRVQRGALIARLDPENAGRTLENAQLSLQKAKAQYQSTLLGQRNNRGSQNQTVASAQTQLENASRSVASAQTNYNNTKSLFDIGGGTAQSVRDAKKQFEDAVSNQNSARVALQTAQNAIGFKQDSDRADLDNLQFAIAQAEISLKNAQSDLAKTKIYAPANGVVSSVPTQMGASVTTQTPLFTLLEDGMVELPVQIDESEIGKVKRGQSAEVTLDALAGQTFSGMVTRIAPQARVVSNIAIFDVMVSIKNPDLKLRPGMSAEAEIIAQELQNVLAVPTRAIETVRERSYVQVAATDPKLEPTRTRVVLGASDTSRTVVVSGLSAGQAVVLPPKGKKAAQQSGGLLPPTN